MSGERRINSRAVFLGVVADIGSSFAVGAVLSVAIAVVLLPQGVAPQELMERMQDPVVLIVSMVLGFCCTVFGGFVAGRVAGRSEVAHAGLVGVIGLLFGLLFIGSFPLWYNVVAFGGTVPFALLGGCLATIGRARTRRGSDNEPGDDGAEPDDSGW
jgi:hypothetical protein